VTHNATQIVNLSKFWSFLTLEFRNLFEWISQVSSKGFSCGYTDGDCSASLEIRCLVKNVSCYEHITKRKGLSLGGTNNSNNNNNNCYVCFEGFYRYFLLLLKLSWRNASVRSASLHMCRCLISWLWNMARNMPICADEMVLSRWMKR